MSEESQAVKSGTGKHIVWEEVFDLKNLMLVSRVFRGILHL